MDSPSLEWLSHELEMDDSVQHFNQEWQQINSFGDHSTDSFTFKSFPSNGEIINQSFTFRSASHNQVSEICFERASSFSSSVISFANSDSRPVTENKATVIRAAAQAQDHVLAERKRREKMTQKFIALSALVPGLKKLDKSTVLDGAINYIKELQERLKTLEEDVKTSIDDETIVGAKRPRLSSSSPDAYSSDDQNLDCCSSSQSSLPEIQVRKSEVNVLLQVYCKQQTGIVKDIFSQIEKYNLTIISSSIIPFGDNGIHITVISQIGDHCLVTSKDLVDDLRMAIQTLF